MAHSFPPPVLHFVVPAFWNVLSISSINANPLHSSKPTIFLSSLVQGWSSWASVWRGQVVGPPKPGRIQKGQRSRLLPISSHQPSLFHAHSHQQQWLLMAWSLQSDSASLPWGPLPTSNSTRQDILVPRAALKSSYHFWECPESFYPGNPGHSPLLWNFLDQEQQIQMPTWMKQVL